MFCPAKQKKSIRLKPHEGSSRAEIVSGCRPGDQGFTRASERFRHPAFWRREISRRLLMRNAPMTWNYNRPQGGCIEPRFNKMTPDCLSPFEVLDGPILSAVL